MRAAEVAELKQTQIINAIEYGHIDIVLAKTHHQHRYVLTQAGRAPKAGSSFRLVSIAAKAHPKGTVIPMG